MDQKVAELYEQLVSKPKEQAVAPVAPAVLVTNMGDEEGADSPTSFKARRPSMQLAPEKAGPLVAREMEQKLDQLSAMVGQVVQSQAAMAETVNKLAAQMQQMQEARS